jgi:FkbM family methyltransferase
MIPDLIYDVGLHNGSDTAYYLHKGFRVVAIDANPVLAAAAQDRFKSEIAHGRLTILNIGIAETEGTLSFWVNEANDTQSSFNEARAKRYGQCHEIRVPCIHLSSVMGKHGVPYYMKVDIEGYDHLCLRSLTCSDRPKYISVEVDRDHDLVVELQKMGYSKFKLINQLTYTSSLPIGERETALRLLRKLSIKLPIVGKAVRSPAIASRLKRVDFDSFEDRLQYTFGEGSSGPFGEDTFGHWRAAEEVSSQIVQIEKKLTAGHLPAGSVWFDIHATW